MTRRRKVLPARRHNATDDSLLIRSAESLGRMIGTLQRQLDAARQLTGRAEDAYARRDGHGADARDGSGKRKAAAATRRVKAAGKSAASARSTSRPPMKRVPKTGAANRTAAAGRRAGKGRNGA